MSDYVKLAENAGDQYLDTLAGSQNSFVEFIATLAAAPPTVSAVLPLPSPHEVTTACFVFAEKMLAQQKVFVDKLSATFTPAASARTARGSVPSATATPATATPPTATATPAPATATATRPKRAATKPAVIVSKRRKSSSAAKKSAVRVR